MSAPLNKHYVDRRTQFKVDARPWLVGMVVTVLCAAVVTLVGLLLANYDQPVVGSAVMLTGYTAVVLGSCGWVVGKVTGEMGIPA